MSATDFDVSAGTLPTFRTHVGAGGWPLPTALAPAVAAIAVCLALLVPTLLAAGFDDRTLDGANIWAKPLKFQLSLAVHFATIIWLAGLIDGAAVAGRLFRWAVLAAAFASTSENFYITLQAARGRASHFNVETPLEAVLYPVMGVGAVTIVAAALMTGLLMWRRPALGSVAGAPGWRLGAIAGTVLGSVLTLVVAGYMSSLTRHGVGPVAANVASLPLTGWSASIGDLRVPHFIATHLMQALPLAGLLADRLIPTRARLVVVLAALVGTALVAATFAQAVAGMPLVAL